MPWKVIKSDQCPSDKPWAVVASGSGEKRGCHATRASALKQLAVLWMKMHSGEIAAEETEVEVEFDLSDSESWQALMEQVVEWAKKDTPPNMAPYKIFKRGSKFVVVNNANEVKARFDDEEKAKAYLRALYRNVPGAAGKNKKWTGKQKRAS